MPGKSRRDMGRNHSHAPAARNGTGFREVRRVSLVVRIQSAGTIRSTMEPTVNGSGGGDLGVQLFGTRCLQCFEVNFFMHIAPAGWTSRLAWFFTAILGTWHPGGLSYGVHSPGCQRQNTCGKLSAASGRIVLVSRTRPALGHNPWYCGLPSYFFRTDDKHEWRACPARIMFIPAWDRSRAQRRAGVFQLASPV